MLNKDKNENMAACSRILSQILYYPPQFEFLTKLKEGGLESWPINNTTTTLGLHAISQALKDTNLKRLNQDFTDLLVGPGKLGAYPWGSVYKDSHRLFGRSERELKAFCATHGIEIKTGINEPCDHIGLVLIMLSILLLREKNEESSILVEQFIDEHLSRWVSSFISQLNNNAQTEFFRGVSMLLSGFLEEVFLKYSSTAFTCTSSDLTLYA